MQLFKPSNPLKPGKQLISPFLAVIFVAA